jgi:flagellar basal body-associated protein FliL
VRVRLAACILAIPEAKETSMRKSLFAILMVAMVGVLVAALGTVIATIRREERESKKRPT